LPALHSALARPSLVTLMRRTGVPTQLSIDAGDYVCNQTLYTSLSSGVAPAVFIHVPRLSSTPRTSERSPRITLAALTRGVEAALVAIAGHVRRMQREAHGAL
jgi:pyroglutamyl-peptidase